MVRLCLPDNTQNITPYVDVFITMIKMGINGSGHDFWLCCDKTGISPFQVWWTHKAWNSSTTMRLISQLSVSKSHSSQVQLLLFHSRKCRNLLTHSSRLVRKQWNGHLLSGCGSNPWQVDTGQDGSGRISTWMLSARNERSDHLDLGLPEAIVDTLEAQVPSGQALVKIFAESLQVRDSHLVTLTPLCETCFEICRVVKICHLRRKHSHCEQSLNRQWSCWLCLNHTREMNKIYLVWQ